jgi:hypothetical protein
MSVHLLLLDRHAEQEKDTCIAELIKYIGNTSYQFFDPSATRIELFEDRTISKSEPITMVINALDCKRVLHLITNCQFFAMDVILYAQSILYIPLSCRGSIDHVYIRAGLE